jgi:hypothetical protein
LGLLAELNSNQRLVLTVRPVGLGYQEITKLNDKTLT